MRTDVSLVVTDLDGTLWHTDDHVPAHVLDAFVTLQRRGVPLLVATGRRHGSTVGPLARHGLSAPMVLLNGALGVLADDARFHRATYPVDQGGAVLAAFRSVGLEPVVYLDDPDRPDIEVVLGPSPSTNPAHAAALAPRALRADPAWAVEAGLALGFSLIGVQHGVAVAAAEAIGELGITHLDRSLDHPGMVSLTVAPLGRSKWDGVLAYCEHAGLDPTRVLALGDGPNDVELLDGAAITLVPHGSHPDALARADHVIGSSRDGGWAEVLDHLG
jgi:hydroxymethylpyrimidine pyrophosphatase-like HAD family hydrolase